ncbi:efflux RND transporter periplasmic adaptor subunit [Chryseobacterium koreense]|uniref:Copper transporter n=1 Tax=Chryseobacterium koreense CCUG 49689 TaxID=1304281 RepID=A0A0J7IX89_9FLAO|nr:efflux RND transporter periplasmic adaptor subunit [Chryseobacterium koreense]KMQ70451.1 copper transporter [Chryseobacterium koreense CCUG 49689]MBB5334432.1 Cu(I)/Ag(I) efflux system membrane fusion protein [Chryseobacterium koreense]
MRNLFLVLMLAVASVSCKNETSKHPDHQLENGKTVYTCPMHPEIISDQPGTCPICKMDLVKKEDPATKKAEIKLETLLQPTDQFVVSSIPLVKIARESRPTEVEAVGVIEYDMRNVGSISSRVEGRIEKLYVRYKYQKVSKGERILDIYSPELLTAQENLLFVLKNDPSNKMMIDASRQKLLLLGMPAQQIQNVIRRGKPDLTVPVFSNYSGHIQQSGAGGGMNPGSVQNQPMQTISATTAELPIKEGMYVKKGENIFSVYNAGKVWARLNIFAEDVSLVSKGKPVHVIPEAAPDKSFRGTIGFIEPFFRPDSKTLSARVYFDNSGAQIPIGSQVKAVISGDTKLSDWLPRSSVVSLGKEKVVFLRKESGFVAHKVITGIESNGKIEISEGLSADDEVAENGQFLVDSESFIKTNN